MAGERPHSSLPQPRSRIPPPTPAGRILQSVAPPNTDRAMMPPPPRPTGLRPKSSSASASSFSAMSSGNPPRTTLAERAGTYGGIKKTTAVPRAGSTITGKTPATGRLVRPQSSLGITGRGTLGGVRPQSSQSLTDEHSEDEAREQAGTREEEGKEGFNEFRISLPKRKDWDVKSQLADHAAILKDLTDTINKDRKVASENKQELEELRRKEFTWETRRVQLETLATQQAAELETLRKKLQELEFSLETERRDHRNTKDDAARKLRDETDELRRKHRDELESEKKAHTQAVDMIERKLRHELMDEKAARTREVQEIKNQMMLEKQRLEMQMDGGAREARTLKVELEARSADLEREKKLTAELRDKIVEQNTNSLTIESTVRALKLRIEELEAAGQTQQQSYAALEAQLAAAAERNAEMEEKLRNEETVRRKLHNQIQELKGNIRVFCRVRPTLPHESDAAAEIRYPDQSDEGKEIEVVGGPERSATGNISTKTYPFTFDKVFGPTHQNAAIFEEISQLVQSALDGYNVCIFCYGQTGSGKTYTMSSEDGMIPRAVHQIYDTAKSLETKGWSYTMHGNFVEVYNENINDLLGNPGDLDKKKHEIRHDPKEQRTTITDVETVILDSPDRVHTILARAGKTRSVAATAANERSSRSHSVFILRLKGVNEITGQRCEGTLNLVDLAGSERLSHSQATGERLKETQSINRSLSCLGDVIAALGSGKEGAHIPYRNSKLTYLLQYSLGGNSKCLMFVMVSPMTAHLNESITSLKFATKVNSTSIGTARKVIKSA